MKAAVETSKAPEGATKRPKEGFIYEPLALNCLTNFGLTNLTCLPPMFILGQD